MPTLKPISLRVARHRIGWTQTELAKASRVSLTTITTYERGLANPRAYTLGLLRTACEALGQQFTEEGELK